jgi:spore coat polysaccharide biosynthesis predicted glycosyltransferase SpsG
LVLSDQIQKVQPGEHIFFMRRLENGVRFARHNGATVQALEEPYDPRSEEQVMLNACKDFHPDLIIVDLPYKTLPSNYEDICSGEMQTWFIDDYRFKNPGASVYLNSSILAPQKIERRDNDQACYLLGPDYFIFSSPENGRSVRTPGKFNVLLTFGGSDPTNLTYSGVSWLMGHDWGSSVLRIVLGPGMSEKSRIEDIVRNAQTNFQIIDQPENIYPYMAGADLVVCSGGRTMYELRFLQRTFLPIGTTKIEGEAIAAFLAHGLIDTGLTQWEPENFLEAFKKHYRQAQGKSCIQRKY